MTTKLLVSRRRAIVGLAAACSLASPWHAGASTTYPRRPITLVIGYAPGGGTDIVGRVLARELESVLGPSVVVENRAGAGTMIAASQVSRAQPDGYTLFFGTNAMVINSLLQAKQPYDAATDFSSIGMVTVQSLALVVNPSLKIHSVADLIAFAQANPGKLNFASSGVGTAQHVAGEAFAQATNLNIVHVPFPGAGPAIQELIAGRVDMMFTGLLGLREHIRGKKILLLATTGKTRTRATPDTPTVAEAAKIDKFVVDSWQGLFGPAKLPPDVVNRLSKALFEVQSKKSMGDRFVDEGMEVSISTPAELHDYVLQDRRSLAWLVDRIKKG